MGVQKPNNGKPAGKTDCNEEADTTSSSFPKVSTSSGVSFSQQQPEVRVLTLNHSDHLDHTLFRLQKGFVLQLRLGPSLFGKSVYVHTNYPEDLGVYFERTNYRQIQWKSYSKNKGDDTSLYVEVLLFQAGTFHYYFTYNECDNREKSEGSGYFIVDPILTVGIPSTVLPLDSIKCHTVMAKCLGTLDRWENTLRVSKESGYNMIHFTPVQELGSSRSGYSIANQLKLNPDFNTSSSTYRMEDVASIVQKMHDDWKVLSLTDIVLNHTTNESPWLNEHPECTYNIGNCPHLRPGYLVDRAIYHFSIEINKGLWVNRGIPPKVVENCHVEAIERVFYDEVLNPLKLEEFYMINVDQIISEITSLFETSPANDFYKRDEFLNNVQIVQDPIYRRNNCTIDQEVCLKAFNVSWPDIHEGKCSKTKSLNEMRKHLNMLNENRTSQIQDHLRKAVSCTIGTIRYDRLQGDGPKLPCVSEKYPLSPLYFTHHGPDLPISEEEQLTFGTEGKFNMAHNGWVMGDDPLKNFANSDSYVYIRRELVAWGDSVKLRYGNKPSDCPYLWNHMREYVEETARIFHGIRLDNCHSTPIHVAEYLIDCARRVRPELYVIAELFTNSDKTDNIFVNRLGINSLIREAMSAPNSHEEGRLVYRYGGSPVGAFLMPKVRPLVPSVAHAVFLDLTHDNKSPCEVRSCWDMLPSTALVNMACCASGSNRGYDEIVPHHIHVVEEERQYAEWGDSNDSSEGRVNANSGIIRCKNIINNLHSYMGENGFCQVFVDQVTDHVVTVTRHNAVTHESIILVAYTAFKPPSQIQGGYLRPLKVQGKLEEILFELSATSENERDNGNQIPAGYQRNSKYINGVNGVRVSVRQGFQPGDAALVRQVSNPGDETTVFEYTEQFKPGSVIAFKVSLLPPAKQAVDSIRSILDDFEFGFKPSSASMNEKNRELLSIIQKLSLTDLNRILFRCHEEEADEGRGCGAYAFDNYGSLVYCGLQGLISAFAAIRVNNDLGHPICGNLRDGDWLPNYVSGRLKLEDSTAKLGQWLEDVFSSLSKVPRFLIPAYFDAIINSVYLILINHAWSSMGRFVAEGSDFCKALGLCSTQFCGVVKSALLPMLSPNLDDPKPSTQIYNGRNIETSATLAAGLPHFSTGYMRNWGRDTFIALPGNLLIPERHQEARYIILAFAGTLRHGLIPNLLDGGRNARFNCRDSVWFWLYSIQRYVQMVPEGHCILKDKVSRLFPNDDSLPQEPGVCDQFLEDVMQEAMQSHFEGVKFRERNAGTKIDEQMNDQGFNNEIGINRDTGFPFGGNVNNCGTWMDKMGSSEKAGNKGTPATPRDGSAVEIVGLCCATTRFLAQMHKEGNFAHEGVEAKSEKWTYKSWYEKICKNFEKYFWIGQENSDFQTAEPSPDLVNKRDIYKDCINASQEWTNYQLRCNFPIALAVAPEIADPNRAMLALQSAEDILLGPLGMKTLDPSDWKYRGDYDNGNDSDDPSVARGFNYHQGPEWLWPVGWFFRAKLLVGVRATTDLPSLIGGIKAKMANHFDHLSSCHFRSLPELTNSNGSHCRDSNPAQSWSTGCILEVLYEMDQIERNQRTSNL